MPFIPYEHFRGSRAYREGYKYTDYLDMLRVCVSFEADLFETRKDWCARGFFQRDELPLWSPPVNATQVQLCNGFLNNIPGGDALLAQGPANGDTFNLVSSHWLDWKTFTLHQTDVTRTPSLRLTSGETVKCHGYISGTWTENGTLSQQWTGLQFFVVDCEFSRAGFDERLHFMIDSTKLSEQNLHHSEGTSTSLSQKPFG